jgi:hypothetical protein
VPVARTPARRFGALRRPGDEHRSLAAAKKGTVGTTSQMLDDVSGLLAQDVTLEGYLGRKGRAMVARLNLSDAKTVVVKGPGRPITDDGSSVDPWSPVNRFRNEVAALQTLEGAGGLVPRLIGVDLEHMWMVLEDLGDYKSLADALLGSDAESATTSVSAWAAAVGQLHRVSAEPVVMVRWESQRVALGPMSAPESAAVVLETARPRIEQVCEITPATEAAVAEVDRRLSDRRWWAMTPRDPCPDNCALRPDGSVVLFDFEGGGIRHSLLDAAYLVTTFPTCWCTGNLPPAVRAAGLAAYRAAAGWSFDDFDQHLAAAAAFHGLWVLSSFRLTDALGDKGDSGWHWSEVGFDLPSARQVVALAVDDLERAVDDDGGLRPLGALAGSLRDGLTKRWGVWHSAPPHPAFLTI